LATLGQLKLSAMKDKKLNHSKKQMKRFINLVSNKQYGLVAFHSFQEFQ